MSIMYNDYGQFHVEAFKEAIRLEIKGMADYHPRNNEKFAVPDNERPSYFSVFIILENGATETILMTTAYSKAREYAEDKARLRNLEVHDYVLQKTPDPFLRVRRNEPERDELYNKLIDEYVSWIHQRSLPQWSVEELVEDAYDLLNCDDEIYFHSLLKRWQGVETALKIDLSDIKTPEDSMYF